MTNTHLPPLLLLLTQNLLPYSCHKLYLRFSLSVKLGQPVENPNLSVLLLCLKLVRRSIGKHLHGARETLRCGLFTSPAHFPSHLRQNHQQ